MTVETEGEAPSFLIVTEAERRAITRARAKAPDDPLVDVVTEILMTAWLLDAGAARGSPKDARSRRVLLAAELLLEIAACPKGGDTP